MSDCSKKLDEIMGAFIKSVDFTFTVEDIKKEYEKYSNNGYVSHTAMICCKFYEKALVILGGE
jgi:hypothetical protein